MALINYAEYFDLDGFNKAIKDLETTNKEFGSSVLSLNKEIKSSYSSVRSELKDYAETLGKFNVNQRDAGSRLGEIGAESQKLVARYKEQEAAMQSLIQVQDLNKASLNELKAASKQLIQNYSILGGSTEDLNAKKAALAEESRRITAAIKLQESALKATKKVVEEAAGSYAAINREALDVLKQLKSMPNAFDATTGKINQNNKAAVELQDRYIKLNATLKTIDGGLGNFQRNVGNYKSGFQGLSNSVNQITREFPAFSNSLQTGFLAISNNLPIFFDELQRANSQIKELQAQGQKVPGLFATLGRSLISFNSLLSLGVTLLTVFGKDIVEFTVALVQGTKTIDAAAVSLDALKKGFAGSEYKKAITDVNELKTAIDLAKGGFIDKDDVVKKYNETVGKTIGLVGSLEEAERKLNEKAEAYIQFTLLKSAANAALQQSADDAAQAQIGIRKRTEEFFGIGGKIGAGVFKAFNQGVGGVTEGLNNALLNIQTQSVDLNQRNSKIGLDIFKEFQEKAAKIAKDNGFNFLGNSKEDKGETNRALNEYRRLLDGREKALKEAYDKEVLDAQTLLDQRLISEVEFQDKKYQAAVQYTRLAANEEQKTNNVGFKARLDKLAEFDNFRKAAGNEYLKTLINEDAKTLESKKAAIQTEAEFKIESLKDAQRYELSNQMLTNAEKVKLELDYQNQIDEITIKALLDRAALEIDIVKRTELLKQASTLRRGVTNRTSFAGAVTIPQATANDEIAAINAVFQRRKVINQASIIEELATQQAIYDILEKSGQLTIQQKEEWYTKLKKLQLEVNQFILSSLKESASAISGFLGADFTAVFDDVIDALSKLEDGFEITWDNIGKYAIDASNLVTSTYKRGIDDQIRASQFQKETELAAVGNNLSARSAIEAKYLREQAALNRKKAVADRDNALFQIGINTAQAVVKSVAESPLTFGLPWAGYALGLGALQAALVLSRKIPQFKGGTEYSPEGPAIVDDGGGAELIIGPDGRIREIGGKGPRLTYLEKGSKVKTAAETKRLLSDPNSQVAKEMAFLKSSANTLSDYKQQESIYTLSKAMERSGMDERVITAAFERAVSKIPIRQTIIDRHGERERVKEGNRTTTYLNSFKIGR